MLFTNEYQPSLNPSFSDPNNDPAYQRQLAEQKKKQLGGDIGFGIAEVGSSLLNLIAPGVGTLASKGIKVGQTAFDNSVQNKEHSIYSGFSNMEGHGGGFQGGQNTFGNLGSALSGGTQNKGFMQLIQNMIKSNADKAFAKAPMQGNQLPTVEQSTGGNTSTQVQTTPSSDGFDLDSVIRGFSGGDSAAPATPDTLNGLWKGGLAPLGKDDIALVDTKDGSDTGIRLQAGEMLVVSRKTLSKLNSALKDGDHKEVYDLMKAQVKVAPTVKDGKEGHAGGGNANTDFDPDKELENINATIAKVEKSAKDKSASDEEKASAEIQLNKLKDAKRRYSELYDKYAYNKKSVESNPNDPNKKNDPEYLKNQKQYLEQLQGVKQQIDQYSGGATVDKTKPPINWLAGSPALGGNLPEVPITAPSNKTNNTAFFKNKPNDQNLDPFDNPPVAGSDESVADLGITKSDYPLNITKPDGTANESNTGLTAGDYAKYYAPEALGTGFDIARGVLGFNAANKPLPTFTKPEAWNQYVNRLHGLSETGLTGNEMTAAQRGIDQTYAYDVDNIRNLSGGNSGQALGNLGRAASSHYGALTNLAALNDEARARNLGQYGGAVSEDVNLNRMIFSDKYNEQMMNKQAGAQLTHDAIQNIEGRTQTDKEYGPGTYYDQINRMNLDSAKTTNAYTKEAQANWAKNGFQSPAVGSASGAYDPSELKYYMALHQKYGSLIPQ